MNLFIHSCRRYAGFTALLGLLAATAVILRAQTPGPPAISFLQPLAVNAGDPAFTLTITGRGFEAGSVVYWGTRALTTSFASANQVTAAVPAELIANAGQASVYIRNSNGAFSNLTTFTINAAALAVTTTSLPGGTVGNSYSHALQASGGTPPYTWSTVDALPAGLALSPAGELSGRPTTAGTFPFSVRVSDSGARSATRALSLVVAPPPFSISTASDLPAASESVEYSVQLATAGGTAPLRWTAGAGLPPGLALASATGLLRGTPTARGSYAFVVQVTDAANLTASRNFTLVVRAAPLVITTVSPLFNATVGTAYSQTFSASGGVPPYTWTLRIPVPGLTLDRNTGVLTGTPGQAGSYNIAVDVADSASATASKEFALAVEQPQVRISTTSPLPAGPAGREYQHRFLAVGGSAPYSWAITSGSVPGLALDTVTGVLSGTPATAGTWSLTVQARDAGGLAASRQFTITITPGPLQLEALPDTLRSLVGQPLSQALTASGGTPPYTWTANGLPAGVDIDPATGEISGSAQTVGSFPFTVRVSDAARATVTELYRLEVQAPPLPSLSLSGMSTAARPAEQMPVQLQVSAPYSLPLIGQLIMTFAPETGSGDPAVQFSTGGRTLDFQLPAGSTAAEFSAPSVGLQTGTVAGTISITARLQTQGVALTPTPVPVQTIRIDRTAPAITAARFTRTGANTIEVRLTGYSTSREMSQGVFRFQAGAGNSLSAPEITMPLEDLFGRWFRDAESGQYGGQFSFTQQFTIQGDANAVTPVSVRLRNQTGTTDVNITQ